MPLPLIGMIGGTRNMIRLGLIAALALAVGAAVLHYRGLKADLRTSIQNEATLRAEVERQNVEIAEAAAQVDEWKAAFERMQAALGELQEVEEAAGDETRRITNVLDDHDLAALARSRPATIERVVNADTARIFRLFECATSERPECPDEAGRAAGTPADTGAAADNE